MWQRRLDRPVFPPPAGRDILEEADRHGMVLIDPPGTTTFRECLAAGIAFLFLFDPAVCAIRTCQREAFRALEAASMVHIAPDPARWTALAETRASSRF